MKKLLLVLFFGSFFIFYLLIGLNRFNSLQVFYYDFGIFYRVIWQVSRFITPSIDHIFLGKILIFGDHFEPSIFILSPLFWITDNIRLLIFEQAIVTVISGFLIYKLSRLLKLKFHFAITISFVFLIFTGTMSPLVTDWHPEPTALLFLLLFILMILQNKLRIAFLSAIIFLGFKESNPVTLFPVLMFIFLKFQEKRKFVLILMAICVIWFLTTTQIIIPFFANGQYLYKPSISSISSEKIKLMTDSYLSFGFLPIFSVFGILTTITEFIIRLVSPRAANFTLNMHYNVYLSAYLAIGSALTLARIKSNFLKNFLLIFLIAISIFSARKVTGSPINLAVNPIFWKNITFSNSFEPIAKLIPKDKSVMAQNNLLVYFANRKSEVFLLSENYQQKNPDIIIFDLNENQNINNFWGPDGDASLDHIIEIETSVKSDANYELILVFGKIKIYLRRP